VENQRRTSSRPDSPVVVLTFAFRDKNTPLTPGCEISPAPGYTDIQMSRLGLFKFVDVQIFKFTLGRLSAIIIIKLCK